jgi:hypothetical protein
MGPPWRAIFGLAILTACVCSAQITPTHTLRIQLPPEVKSETFFARYTLSGQDMGGWVQPRAGVDVYSIDTMERGRPAGGIKALLWAQGCAVQTMDISLLGQTQADYRFVCRPVPAITITGKLRCTGNNCAKGLRLQARYVARWARDFLALSSDMVPVIPVGGATIQSDDGSFGITVPDLARDPVAGAANHDGELQVWAREPVGDAIPALVVPESPANIKTRMGGMKLMSEYPAGMVFSICPTSPAMKHDRDGFAIRPPASDACSQ